MTGTGTLTVGSGQIQFWQDNTIDIAQINLADQGFIANAGENEISSVITGSNGLRKLGEGKLILSGSNSYTGTTRVSGGELERIGNLSNAQVDSGATLTVNSGSLSNVSTSYGTINLINSSLSQALSGYGTVVVDTDSSFAHQSGGYFNRVINLGMASNAGSLSSVDNNSGATFTNTKNISRVYNSGTFNTGTFSDISSVRNYSTAAFTNGGEVAWVDENSGSFINNGSVNFVDKNSGNFTNNGAIGSLTYAGFIDNSTGTFTNNGTVDVYRLDVAAGTFTNNDRLRLKDTNASYSKIAGALVNNTGATTSLENSDINVTGTITNKGTVTVDADSSITGTGTYRQRGNKDATTVVDGRIETSVEINHGELSGTGYIVGDLLVTAAGTIRPGNSPGLLSIGGDFTLEEGADLVLEIFGNSTSGFQFDQLSITGNYNLFGNILFDLGTGVDVSIFDTTDPNVDPLFSLTDFFTYEDGASLELAVLAETNVKISDALGEVYRMSFDLDETTGALTTSVAAVPVPAAVWLFGSGLIGLFGVARRRKAA